MSDEVKNSGFTCNAAELEERYARSSRAVLEAKDMAVAAAARVLEALKDEQAALALIKDAERWQQECFNEWKLALRHAPTERGGR